MRVKLTAKSVETVKPPKKGRLQLWDAALPGFGLRVTETGKKSWVVMYGDHLAGFFPFFI